MTHIPVLSNEVLKYLDPKPNENFIDCTTGQAGHTMAILEKNGPDGKVLGIERDPEIFENTKLQIQNTKYKDRLLLVCDNFANLKKIVEEYNFKPVNGILFDLGISSWHLDGSGRGFSFRKDELLDMRFDPNQELTAEEIINKWPEKDLIKIFQEYGEERFARRIAERICEERKRRRIKTTFQLIEVVRKSFPRKYKFGKIHCATRIFQALRIAVNDELENLKKVLPQSLEILEPEGKVVIVSFHSLEDRIVKNFFRDEAEKGKVKILTKKPIKADREEIKKNPKSRSAKLRTAMKLAS